VVRGSATPILFSLCLVLLCAPCPGAAWGEGSPATVTGAERLLVRRGPGTRYPPVAALSRGSKVDVQSVQGEWARIETARGERGYVKRAYLVFPQKERRSPARAGGASTAPAPAAPGGSPAAALQAATERNKSLEAEVHSLRQELTELQNRSESTPVATANSSATASEQLPAELTRLAAAVEGLQRRFDARLVMETAATPATAPSDDDAPTVSAVSVLFAMIGILVGWFVGTYGRKQERGRRTRVRF
jgi:uncharacterized protein YgiM (DUF1202 family)